MNSQNFSGADVDQLRALSARLKVQSGKMREIANSSNWALQVAEWSGGEIDAIREQWRRNSNPAILRMADALERLGSDLDGHVAEQERASRGGASIAGSVIDKIRRSIDRFMLAVVGPFIQEGGVEKSPAGAPDPSSSGPRSEGQGAGTAQLPPTVDASTRNSQVLTEWRSTVPNGTKVDWDGQFGVQCVDLVRHYMNAHFPGQNLGGGFLHAFQIYEAADPNQFARIPPGGSPQPGDIIVIGPNGNSPGSGHVAIVERVDANGTVHVVQQSGVEQDRGVFTGSPSQIEMNALVGYLRPKHP